MDMATYLTKDIQDRLYAAVNSAGKSNLGISFDEQSMGTDWRQRLSALTSLCLIVTNINWNESPQRFCIDAAILLMDKDFSYLAETIRYHMNTGTHRDSVIVLPMLIEERI